MKLTMVGDYRPALVVDDRAIDLVEAAGSALMNMPARRRMPALIERLSSGALSLAAYADRDGTPLSQLVNRGPLLRPGKILVALSNHEEGVAAPAGPISLALKSPSSILEPDGVVDLPAAPARVFHHEAQLGIVIGRAGKAIRPDQAFDHVFGCTGVLNINARGLGFGMGANTDSFDSFTPMGPWIVTADEIPDIAGLRLEARVQGEVREDYSLSDLLHPVEELIAFASRLTTLEPGDVILTGACYQGVGPVQHGDALELEIGGIGHLRAKVCDALRRRWPRGVDVGVAEAARRARLEGGPVPFKMVAVAQLAQETL